MGNDNTSSLKDKLKIEWQKRHRTGCLLLIMSISVVAYAILIGVSLFNTKIAVSGDLLIDLIIRLSFLVALSLMTGFWLRFLGRTYSEIQQDNLQMSRKILDAYNALLEADVKKEKKNYEPKSDEDKDKKQLDLELLKLELELTEIKCELRGKECELVEIECELQEAKANTGLQTDQNIES